MRAYFKKKSAILLIFAISFIFGLSFWVKYSGVSAVYFNGTTRLVPIYSVDRNDNKISISFDCAYGADYTLKLLDILDEYDVKCTFFVVKFWADKFPDVLKEISNRGHEIGTHSSTHPNMSKLSEAQIISELTTSSQKITEITGKKVELFRPPYGDYDDDVITSCADINYYPIQWDIDSLDWKNYGKEDMIERVVNHKALKNGSIILMHNGAKYTASALQEIIDGLRNKGYEIVPISELIYKENYTIDVNGRQKQE